MRERVGSDTRQERADSVEEHRDTFSSGQSLVKVHTVADRLASLSFREQGQRRQEKEKRRKKEREGKKGEGRNKKTSIASKHTNVFFLITPHTNPQIRTTPRIKTGGH